MTTIVWAMDRFLFTRAPAARPAMLRILLGSYTLVYLGRRYKMFLKVARSDPALFQPVGAASLHARPVRPVVFRRALIATLVANVAFILGWRHRTTGPLFSGLLLWVLSYRNSWLMIYHSDNVLVLHALILGVSSSADTLSLDSLRKHRSPVSDDTRPGFWPGADTQGDWRYGWPIQLMNGATALSYFVSAVAKLVGPLGTQWASGEALRSQVAIDGLRKELLGEGATPLSYRLYDNVTLFRVMALGSLLVELGAPVLILDKRIARVWAANAFLMHWGILFVMGIKFRYQLSGVMFASFFDVERLAPRLSSAPPEQER